MAYQSLVPKVASAFGLDYVSISPPQKGYRNESYHLTLASHEDVNLIFHKHEPGARDRIASADEASSVLDAHGFPVRTRFDNRTLRISDGKKEVFAGVYVYLPGKTIPWEAYTKDHIKLLGWAMSDMHGVWSKEKATTAYRVADELWALIDRMDRYFALAGVEGALQNKLGLTTNFNLDRYKILIDRLDATEEHVLHMDLVRGNALFGENAASPWRIGDTVLSGIIDFEKAAVGHPVYDIARTLAFLLVDCANKDRRSIFKYFLQSGYNKRGAGTFGRYGRIAGLYGHDVLNSLIGLYLIHDFYKFLKHTPYESLGDNHHFIRTRDILAGYDMIRLSID